jgi:hypothetical protein
MTTRCMYDRGTGYTTLALLMVRLEEEGGYEEAAYHPGSKGQAEGHLETGVLYQPLTEGSAGHGEAGSGNSSAVPLCPVEAPSHAPDQSGQAQGQPCARDAFLGIHIDLGHVIHVVKHFWSTVGSDVETGAKEAWKATQASGRVIWQGVKGAWEDWNDSGDPVP